MAACAAPKIGKSEIRLTEEAKAREPWRTFQCHPGVLVVDDEDYMRDLLRKGLEQEGFEVWLAGSGWQAFDLYEQHSDKIAVVVLDVCMRGLDGLQTLQCLQHINPRVRACFMSGGIGNYAQTELLDAGAIRIFWKPFALSEIAAVLRRIIDDRPVAQPA